MREEDLIDAAMLAFKMNKLRDFYFALNRLVLGRHAPCRAHIPGMPLPPGMQLKGVQDPVQAILNSQSDFRQVIDYSDQLTVNQQKEKVIDPIQKVVNMLIEEDLKKLMLTIKKLNAR
jgi:hypothetical protein